MRNITLGVLVMAMIVGGVAALLYQQGNTPEARRDKLAEEFISVLPDSLTDRHREEIRSLFETLWYRHERGLVADADVDSIMTKMQDFVDAGRINGKELVYYMAEVGYKTYSGEERYRLPSGVVDHPVLNPKSATIDLLPDTTGFNAWREERERKQKQEQEENAGENAR